MCMQETVFISLKFLAIKSGISFPRELSMMLVSHNKSLKLETMHQTYAWIFRALVVAETQIFTPVPVKMIKSFTSEIVVK